MDISNCEIFNKILLIWPKYDLTSQLTKMLLFAAGTDFSYCIFLAANEKFMDVSVRASAKWHVLGPQYCSDILLFEKDL